MLMNSRHRALCGTCLVGLLWLFVFRVNVSAAEALNLESLTPENLLLRAERLVHDPANGTVDAEGMAIVEAGEWLVSANHILLNLHTGALDFDGHVHLQGPGTSLRSESLHLEAAGKQWRVSGMWLVVCEGSDSRCETAKRKRFQVKSALLERSEDGRWQLTDVWFSPCDCRNDAPSWAMRCEKADLHENERVRLTRPVLEVKGTPVFALPYAEIPLSQRRSGFLAPSFGYSDTLGFVAAEDYFWATSRQNDLTFGLLGATEKGVKPAGEFRYERTRLSGRVGAAYLYDLQGDREDVATHRFDFRWWQDWRPLRGLRQKSDLTLISDADMQGDFARDWRSRESDWVENRLQIHTENETFFAGVEFGLMQERFSAVEADGQLWSRRALNQPATLPMVRLSLPAHPFFGGGLLVSSEVEAAWMTRTSGRYDDVGRDGFPYDALDERLADSDRSEGDNRFQTGEPVAEAGRFTFRERLYSPVSFGRFAQLIFDGGLAASGYWLTADHDEQAGDVWGDAGATLSSSLYRLFDLPREKRFKHEMTAWLSWHSVLFDEQAGAIQGETLRYLSPLDFRVAPHRGDVGIRQRFVFSKQNETGSTVSADLLISQGVFADSATREKMDGILDDTQAALDLHSKHVMFHSDLGIRWTDPGIGSATTWLDLGPLQGMSLRGGHSYLAPGPAKGRWIEQWRETPSEGIHALMMEPSYSYRNIITASYGVDVSLAAFALVEQVWRLGYRSPCRCWRADLSIYHRPGQTAPDVYFSLDLTPFLDGG